MYRTFSKELGTRKQLIQIVVMVSCWIGFLHLTSGVAIGQSDPQNATEPARLPTQSQPINYGLMVRYVDDALARAFIRKSNVIVIIKTMRPKKLSLVLERVNNVKNYIRFRGFENFEVVVDLEASMTERIDIHVEGELLYSLPLDRESKLEGPS